MIRMIQKLLCMVAILSFAVGCSKDGNNLDTSTNKSRLYNNLLGTPDTKEKLTIDSGCAKDALNLFKGKEVTLYNELYQKILTSDGSIAGTWDGALIWVASSYKGPIWKHAQYWSFTPRHDMKKKYGGEVFAISNKIGWGKWRDIALDIDQYKADNGIRKTYPLKLYRDPSNKDMPGRKIFEFIITECRPNGTDPIIRGLLVHRGTDRLVQVKGQDYSETPIVLFGEKYDPARKDSYDNRFLWEVKAVRDK